MAKIFDFGCNCANGADPEAKSGGVTILSSMEAVDKDSPRPLDLEEYDKPGYTMCPFVDGFTKTAMGAIPSVKTTLDKKDILSTVLVRTGINRSGYKVAPGLYCAGTPTKDSEVLVTANFKLTFDHLRRELEGIDAWILVLDTKGINVWCAAGKKTFSTAELVNRVKSTGLDRIVSHRRLIVPQLGATGISAQGVKKASGFEVVYGPIRAGDIPLFLKNDRKADEEMRKVTFNFLERVILTPVELKLLIKPVALIIIALFLLSGFGPGYFSFSNAWSRGLTAVLFLVVGILSGVVITPALLPFIPFREFAAKGMITGFIFAVLSILLVSHRMAWSAALFSMALFTISISSIVAMHFTGATPFTSPSGVEKEMRRFLPVQAICIVLSTGLWIYSAF